MSYFGKYSFSSFSFIVCCDECNISAVIVLQEGERAYMARCGGK